jgi:hypothetical protein
LGWPKNNVGFFKVSFLNFIQSFNQHSIDHCYLLLVSSCVPLPLAHYDRNQSFSGLKDLRGTLLVDLFCRSFSRADRSIVTGTSDSQKGQDPVNTQNEIELPTETPPEFAGSTSVYVVLGHREVVNFLQFWALLDQSLPQSLRLCTA